MNNASYSWLRRVATGISMLSVLVPSIVVAASIQFESETLVRAFERNTPEKEDALVVPLYEYLRGNVGTREDTISFHLSAWGRLDPLDEGYYQDDTAGELMYGYLEVKPADYNVGLRLGRQYLFDGVSNELVDGVAVSAEAKGGVLFSLYGGLPVSLSTTSGTSGDALYGGRIAHRGESHTVGVSYKLAENDSETAQEVVGGDVALFLPADVNIFGVSRYNLETENFAEHHYEARFNLAGLGFRPFVQRFSYEDYFSAGAKTVNPFRCISTTCILNA